MTEVNKNFDNQPNIFSATTCFVISAFTVLTFLIDLNRFTYPERPILYFALCQCATSLGMLVQSAARVSSDGVGTPIGCAAGLLRRADAPTMASASSSSACLGSFILVHYFKMAGDAWWVVVTVAWVSSWAERAGLCDYSSY